MAGFPLGPVMDGMGVNITIMSYRGVLYWGLASDARAVPRLWDIAAAIPLAARITSVVDVFDAAALSRAGGSFESLTTPRTIVLWAPLLVAYWMTIGVRASFFVPSERQPTTNRGQQPTPSSPRFSYFAPSETRADDYRAAGTGTGVRRSSWAATIAPLGNGGGVPPNAGHSAW